MTSVVENRRLRWRCRRGMKELDVLLERFVNEQYETLSTPQRQTFADFLELPDPIIASYLLGHEVPTEPALATLTQLIAETHA